MQLFELVGIDESKPFSPYCWRTRLALAHKGLTAETIPWRFTQGDRIRPHGSEKVPVLLDGAKAVADSWAIANYLEDAYPDRPSLFGGEGGRKMARMINAWGDVAVIGGIFPMIVGDIVPCLRDSEVDYFRSSREARLGKSLEVAMVGRDETVVAFRRSLEPLRLTLRGQQFIGGDWPNYADYSVFGGFQWSRIVSPFRLLTPDDPVQAWCDRMLDMFDGLARRTQPYAA